MRDFIQRVFKGLILKKKKGFSLIELMIVLAIIGFLTAMAVPNFLRFQLKAKQSEAKAQLGAVYMAQKAFFTEWLTYFSDFRDLGYAPEGDLTYQIQLANTPMPQPVGYTYTGGACSATSMGNCTAMQLWETSGYCADAVGNCTELASASDPAATGAVAQATFTAVAGANIDGDTTLDEWQIDHEKDLENVLSDL